MTYHQAYIRYLVEYHTKQDWFECHEIMEECWKEERDVLLKPSWHMLVKLAVAQYHERRGNHKGAVKLYRGVLDLFPLVKWDVLALDSAQIRHEVECHLAAIEQHMQTGQTLCFEPINLLVKGHALLQACEEYCNSINETWQMSNMPADHMIIHRHLLRDRTDVITARSQAMESRRKKYNLNDN